jgi:hypothetical protein
MNCVATTIKISLGRVYKKRLVTQVKGGKLPRYKVATWAQLIGKDNLLSRPRPSLLSFQMPSPPNVLRLGECIVLRPCFRKAKRKPSTRTCADGSNIVHLRNKHKARS